MEKSATTKALSYLYRIVEAGEKGYAGSAANVNNQGLKLLLTSHAQQRAKFGSEILAEIERLGADAKPRSSYRGILHRGRINIFAALAIGTEDKERIILNEIMVGEAVALRAYESTRKKSLPAEIHDLIERQYEEVRRSVEQISLLRGKSGKRLIVQLFNSHKNTDTALNELENAGFHVESSQRMVFHNSHELKRDKRTIILETSASGAVGGALWGALIGSMAGLGAEQGGNLVQTLSPGVHIWILVALAGILAGGIIGAALGYAIGLGVSQEDTYQFDRSFEREQIILLALLNNQQSSDARQILAQVNFDAKSLSREIPT